jgi:hypothetical protein
LFFLQNIMSSKYCSFSFSDFPIPWVKVGC